MTAVHTIRMNAGRKLVDRLRHKADVGGTAVAAVVAVAAIVILDRR